jgi:predicted lipid-binding transport protein (Tim44 family)
MSRKTWIALAAGCFSFVFLLFGVLRIDAEARIGGGGSFGSRGSRTYSSPSRSMPSSPSSPSSSYQPPSQPSQPGGGLFGGGGFMRGLAGGIAGGFLGSMLFRGLGFGAGGGWGGGGIGLFEILLFAVILFIIYRFVRKRRERAFDDAAYYQGTAASPGPSYQPYGAADYGPPQPAASDVESGLRYIRQMDPSFDEGRFGDVSMDLFFKLQGAWGVRDLTSVRGLMTDEAYRTIQGDADRLKAERKINKLDNIAVRSTDIVEAWQESGRDYITVHFYANLLDYTVDEDTGQVTAGSKTEPVKFEEYWTFTRPVGNNPWQLSAINQA